MLRFASIETSSCIQFQNCVIEAALIRVQDWTRAAKELLQDWPQVRIGIHTHNDCDMAVANSLAAVRGGATLIQGCMNGYGERTGNANLVRLYTSLILGSTFPLVCNVSVLVPCCQFHLDCSTKNPDLSRLVQGPARPSSSSFTVLSRLRKTPSMKRCFVHNPSFWFRPPFSDFVTFHDPLPNLRSGLVLCTALICRAPFFHNKTLPG